MKMSPADILEYPIPKVGNFTFLFLGKTLDEIQGILNQEQVPEYADAKWDYDVPDDQVMVLHTLVVSPKVVKKGYGSRFVGYYEQFALEHNCHYLRMDTNEKNRAARTLYKKLGYKEVSIVPCEFNGIKGVRLVCLEKKL